VANLKSISHRCHPILVAFVWELTAETIDFPIRCLQGGMGSRKELRALLRGRIKLRESFKAGSHTLSLQSAHILPLILAPARDQFAHQPLPPPAHSQRLRGLPGFRSCEGGGKTCAQPVHELLLQLVTHPAGFPGGRTRVEMRGGADAEGQSYARVDTLLL